RGHGTVCEVIARVRSGHDADLIRASAAFFRPFRFIVRVQGRDPAISRSLAWATTQISKKCEGRRYMLPTSSLQYVSVRHDHAVEVPTENGIDRATGRGPISDRTCSHQAMRPEMSWRSQEPKEHRRIGTLLCRKVEDQIREYNRSA